MKQLYTRWGRELDPQNVLPEYPRPLLRRSSYTNLNGYWDYAFTREFKIPEKYDGQILVPFSPEAVLSGVSRQLMPDEYLWYRRIFIIEGWNGRKSGRRLILHFGAVDQACAVYVNGQRAARHTGGYLPFEADITQLVRDGENELIVAVKDLSDTSCHARGKQRLERGGMFYTAQSGIWQTVWMEEVPETYIQTIESVTDPDAGTVRIRVTAAENNKYEGTEVKTSGHQEGDRASGLPVQVQIHRPGLYTDSCEYSGAEEILCRAIGSAGEWIEIAIPDIMLWTCETPYLYFYTVTLGEDQAESYFAMRRFSVEKDEKGIPRICMNGEVQFQNGVLDQGYWPDGLYTAPSDEAMIFDITEMKRCGFNMVRKHIKIEPQRWYWHCDRLGIVVWQDMVNGGEAYRYWFVTYLATVMSWRNIKIKDSHPWLLARRERTGRTEFVREMKETIRLLKGHPSICTWVIFNEGWGQFQTKELTCIAREADPDRLIDPASGWFDQGGGDLQSVHNYFFRLKVRPEKERAAVLSEIGGHTYREPDHSACEELYGYGACRDKEALGRAYRELTKKVKKLIPQGLCASVYTQWTDIEEEINGVYTWDREVRKIL
ncbi:glycoside hydrolase family 2 [Mediterraneibacter glycyrrhizinilyticus]|uniref:glycoside hydrolase family 2 protein n=1 Tax=Mediterraneibacter glycyrrhizinilyticus TaxID=342942 RepID=UPI00265981A0|nr:sugar-binding domain-containing protein [Mediterraneibacter glycyrrhizinilyticus]MCF2567830.1 glycoside hydrolase family 2 [Mediterraneibacter glycyrrhizinilyticus]